MDKVRPFLSYRIVAWWVAVILLMAAPVGLGWAIMRAENASLRDLYPFYSDEIYYWHQAATFARVGFANGPYSVGEIPAQIGRYHAWGLAAPILYGTIGHFTGWPLWAIPIVNLVLVGLALAVWVWIVQPDLKQLVMALLLLMTFAPFVTQISSSMFELVQYAWALVLAGVLTRILASSSPQAARWRYAALYLVCVVALFRVTWAVIIPIVGVLALRHRGWRGMGAGWFIGIALAGAMYMIYTLTAAPYSEYVPHLKAFSQGWQVGLEATWTHIRVNIDTFLHGETIELSLRLQVLLISVLIWGGFLLRWLTHSDNAEAPSKRAWIAPYDIGEVLFHTFLLLGELFLIIVVYDVGSWRDYRLLSSHVLLSGFLLLGRRRWGILAVVLTISCLTVPAMLQTTHEWTNIYLQQRRIVTRLDEWNPKIDALIQYDPTATNPWCNTITHTVYYAFVSTYTLLAVDPGMGLSLLLSENDVHLPFKARYLLLDNNFIAQHAVDLNVIFLISVPGGVLYRNLDVRC